MSHVLLDDDSKLAHKLVERFQLMSNDITPIVYRVLKGDDLEYTITLGDFSYKLVREPDDVYNLYFNGEQSLINEQSYLFLSEVADDYLFESALEREIIKSSAMPDKIKLIIEDAMCREFGREWEYDDGALYHYYLDLVEKYCK